MSLLVVLAAYAGLAAPANGHPPAEAESPQVPSPSEVGVVRGRVERAGDRTPMGGAQVLIVPANPGDKPGEVRADAFFDPQASPPAWVESGETDEDGRFSVEAVPTGPIRIVVLAEGHLRLEWIVEAKRRAKRPLRLFVEQNEESAYRTVVETQREPEPGQVGSRELQAEEIATAPGVQGDPLRALQNLPGVARSPGGLGLLVLRGASPNQSRVFLGGHPLPRAFHALALSSVVPAAAIDRLEFIPGNFPSRYGDATGGVVVMHPARLQRQGFHGHGRVDLLGVGGMVGGPVGKGAFMAAGQRGWVDAVLRTVEAVDETQTFLLPRYYDYQTFFEVPLGPRGVLTARALGAGDRVQSRTPAALSGETDRQVAFELGSQFHRADLSWRTRHGGWRFWLTPSFRFERNTARQPTRDSASIRDDYVVSLRAEAMRPLSRRVTLLVGADAEVDRYQTELSNGSDSGANSVGGAPQTRVEERGLQSAIGVYTQADFRVARWSIVPALRLSGFTLGTAAESALDPRISAHWRFAERWKWSMGAGLYSQALVPQRTASGDFIDQLTSDVAGFVILPASIRSLEPRAGFAPVADAIEVARAVQASTAISRELGDTWFVELGAFARVIDNADGKVFNAVTGAATPTTSTYSTAYGLEALARRRLGPRLWGWLGYTLSAADNRVLDPINPADRGRVTPTSFDQRHNLVMLASYRLPHRWRIGGRFRLVSGSPYTDIAGPVWVPNSSNVLVAGGPPNGERFPVFHQLDVRVDKQWVLRRVSVGTYFDVQNVYNRVNPEAYIYDYDLRTRVNAIGLPIFPSLGLRVDY